MRRSIALVAAAVALAGVLTPASAGRTSHPDALCAQPTVVDGLGATCPTPYGYQVLLRDGSSVFTHGFDPVVAVRYAKAGGAKPRDPACVRDPENEFYGRVIYARARDTKAVNVADKVAATRQAIRKANGFLHAEARSMGASLDLRVRCLRGEVQVNQVVLPTAFEHTTFDTIVSDLRELGFTSFNEKYWVWFDGHPPREGAAGVGQAYPSDGATVTNPNNHGPSVAVAYRAPYQGSVWGTLLHEIMHTLGAVSPYAPHGSGQPNGRGGGMHCNDGLDIMCYPDNASRSNYRADVCRATRLDCRRNDYFNPSAKRSSWLGSHWNVAAPLDRFVEGCRYETGSLTAGTLAGTAGVDPEGAVEDVTNVSAEVGAATVTIPRSCRGRRFALSGWLPSLTGVDEVDDTIFGILPFELREPTRVPDFDVCFFRASSLLSCATADGTDAGTVPKRATRARVLYDAGPPATYIFSIV